MRIYQRIDLVHGWYAFTAFAVMEWRHSCARRHGLQNTDTIDSTLYTDRHTPPSCSRSLADTATGRANTDRASTEDRNDDAADARRRHQPRRATVTPRQRWAYRMPAEAVESIPNRTRKRASRRSRAINFRQVGPRESNNNFYSFSILVAFYVLTFFLIFPTFWNKNLT